MAVARPAGSSAPAMAAPSVLGPLAVGGATEESLMPGKYDLEIYQGDRFYRSFRIRHGLVYADLTGFTVRAQIRTAPEADPPVADFVGTVDADQVTNPGKFAVYLSAAETALLDPGNYVWDLELEPAGGEPQTVLAGDVTVTAEVTRP